MVRGWGEFTWGMTAEEVEEIDPHYYREQVSGEGYREIYRETELFDKEFTLWLRFKEGEGLDAIKLTHDQEKSEVYNTEFVLRVYSILKAKYGQGSLIKREEEEGEVSGYPDTGYTRYDGHLRIDHIWYLEETVITYYGSAGGSLSYPGHSSPASLFAMILYAARGTLDEDQL